MEDYKQVLQAQLKEARARVQKSVAAGNFLNTDEGKLIQDWVNTRISALLNDMTAKTPLSHDEYLAKQGAVYELKDFNAMLTRTEAAGTVAQEDVDNINDQLKEA